MSDRQAGRLHCSVQSEGYGPLPGRTGVGWLCTACDRERGFCWETHGKRTALVNKRHYVHRDSEGSFWEGLETFLMDTYDYQRHEDLLLINGDGANWITACQVYFKDRACFTLDRFLMDGRDLFLTTSPVLPTAGLKP